MKGKWVKPEIRDEIVDFVKMNKERTGLPETFFVKKLGIYPDKFIDWKRRYGKDNRHNSSVPRYYWIEEWEKEAVIEFYRNNDCEGYRRCAYMMMDRDIVYLSPSSVYRILSNAGELNRWNTGTSEKGKGFNQPSGPHKHWHIDITYVRIQGIYYYLICILDGYSRYIVHWDLREEMEDKDIGIVQQTALEKYSDKKPCFITDNGGQFISKNFKEFISSNGLTHIKTSPHYPQSNGKIERFHKSIKGECIRKKSPLYLKEAKEKIEEYIKYYNEERLHSSLGYITPKDVLEGRREEIKKGRERKLEKRREERKRLRKKRPKYIFSEKENKFVKQSTPN